MPIEIRMPRLTDAMTEGVVVAWRKREGDRVLAGEVIAEIQADKTTVDFEAPEDGTLGKIVTPAGAEAVEVGDLLALLHTSADGPSLTPNGVPDALEPRQRNAKSRPDEPAETVPAVAASLPEASAEPEASSVDRARRAAPADVAASPLARGMAAQAGIELGGIRRNGIGGRIMMADILRELGVEPRLAQASSEAVAARASADLSHIDAPYDEVPHSPMRQAIARTLVNSKQTIPHFYLASHCEIDALLQLKAELQSRVSGELKLSINDFLIRAAALALRATPEVNVSWTGAATRAYRRVDIAVAVATQSGLITPIVRDAGRKGVAEIASEVRDLAGRARSGRLRPEEYQGGTFTISNLGMYDVDEIGAIINPPQAAILGIGTARPRPVVHDGSVVVATMMTCTLSADHRALDGAAGARFLSRFKNLVQRPTTMML